MLQCMQQVRSSIPSQNSVLLLFVFGTANIDSVVDLHNRNKMKKVEKGPQSFNTKTREKPCNESTLHY